MLKNNLLALGVTLIIALIWLRINDYFAHRGWVSSTISRKIIHVGTGPIFVLCWLLFNASQTASFLAAIVPLGITIQFALVGFGVIKDPSAVEAMSRSGDRREILKGPIYYGLVFILITVIFWRDSAVGIIALMLLCGGDGLADISGSLIGGRVLPWSKKKTLVGSLTMLLGGFIFSVVLVWIFVWRGFIADPMSIYILPIAIISFVTTLIESLPFENIDNITVPIGAILVGLMVI